MNAGVRRAFLVVVMLAALVAGGASPATADPTTREQVYDALALDRIPAHYVILVDVSGSMQAPVDHFTPVKESLRRLFAALSPQDVVTLLTFDGAVHSPTWDSALGNSPNAPVDRLPTTAAGPYSDIGVAIGAGVKALAAGSDVATLILLTDGGHQPAPGSAYPQTQGFNWNQLTDDAAAITKESLSAYAIPLANGATGANLLRQVIPTAEVLAPADIADLTTWLNRPQETIRRAKARSLLASEVSAHVTVTWPVVLTSLRPGTTHTSVTLARSGRWIPLELTGIRLDSSVPGLVGQVAADRVALAGEQAQLPVTVDWDVGPPSDLPVHPVSVEGRLTLVATVSTPWAAVLQDDLDLTVQADLVGAQFAASGRANTGRPAPWLAGSGGVAVLAGLLAVGLWLRRHPRADGRLVVADVGGTGRGELALGRRRPITVPMAKYGVEGAAEVRAVRIRLGGRGPAVPVLDVVYNPTGGTDGAAAARVGEARLGRGETAVVSGVQFRWIVQSGSTDPTDRRA
jgi:Mg-chelatase subunit ChlD